MSLVKIARQLPRRRKTTIVVPSLDDCAEEARREGADAFLRKPHYPVELPDTVRRLLERPEKR